MKQYLYFLFTIVLFFICAFPATAQIVQGGGDEKDCEEVLEPANFNEVNIIGQSGSSLDLYGGSHAGWNNQIRFFESCEGAIQHIIAGNSVTGRLVIAPGFFGNSISDVMEVQGRVSIATGNTPATLLPSGASLADYKLYVNGGILANEVRVAIGWADYVFEQDYDLLPLTEVKQFIAANQRLPNVPPAAEIEQQGLPLGDITVKQQEKIEELFLYLIEMEDRISAVEEENEALRKLLLQDRSDK